MAHRALAIIRRRLFACITVLSLLLCLATVALWVRSYWRCDVLLKFRSDARSGQAFGMWSTFGELGLGAWHFPAGNYGLEQGWNFRTRPSSATETIASFANYFPQGQSTQFLGFGVGYTPAPFYSARYVCPHWFCVLSFAVLPAVRLRSILRTRRRDRAGLCQHCGYDLRATPQGGRCPECGQVASPAPPVTMATSSATTRMEPR